MSLGFWFLIALGVGCCLAGYMMGMADDGKGESVDGEEPGVEDDSE